MNDIDNAAIGLLWSLWTELGIPGSQRGHKDAVLDPEPLILWTPHLAATEPRLLGLAFDWCVAHAEHLGKSRLTALSKLMPEAAVQSFAGFSGALRAHKIRWTPSGPAAAFEVNRATMDLPLERPALLRFRMRALTGSTARAEVLCRCLELRARLATIKELTPRGVQRRSAERIIEELRASSILEIGSEQRGRKFRLRHAKDLGHIVGLGKLNWTDWHAALAFIDRLKRVTNRVVQREPFEHSRSMARMAVSREWDSIVRAAADLHIPPPPGSKDSRSNVMALEQWGTHFIQNL